MQSNRRRILKGVIDNLHYSSGTSTQYYQRAENRRYSGRNSRRSRRRTTKIKKDIDRSCQQFLDDIDDEKDGILSDSNDISNTLSPWRSKYERPMRRNESQNDEYEHKIKTKEYKGNQLDNYNSMNDLSDSNSRSSSYQIRSSKHYLKNKFRKLNTNQSTSTSNSDV